MSHDEPPSATPYEALESEGADSANTDQKTFQQAYFEHARTLVSKSLRIVVALLWTGLVHEMALERGQRDTGGVVWLVVYALGISSAVVPLSLSLETTTAFHLGVESMAEMAAWAWRDVLRYVCGEAHAVCVGWEMEGGHGEGGHEEEGVHEEGGHDEGGHENSSGVHDRRLAAAAHNSTDAHGGEESLYPSEITDPEWLVSLLLLLAVGVIAVAAMVATAHLREKAGKTHRYKHAMEEYDLDVWSLSLGFFFACVYLTATLSFTTAVFGGDYGMRWFVVLGLYYVVMRVNEGLSERGFAVGGSSELYELWVMSWTVSIAFALQVQLSNQMNEWGLSPYAGAFVCICVAAVWMALTTRVCKSREEKYNKTAEHTEHEVKHMQRSRRLGSMLITAWSIAVGFVLEHAIEHELDHRLDEQAQGAKVAWTAAIAVVATAVSIAVELRFLHRHAHGHGHGDGADHGGHGAESS